MSLINMSCIFCLKDCKLSDSKPYPNSKSKDRIHNRCFIKKTLSDKQGKLPSTSSDNPLHSTSNVGESKLTSDLKSSSVELMKKLADENEARKNAAHVKKLNEMIANHEEKEAKDKGKSSFFFDMKAGIAKKHEKQRYLNHRNLCEMAPRYNEHGLQEESIGRTYDHTGRDLSTLGDNSEEDESELEHVKQSRGGDVLHSKTGKRKSEEGTFDYAPRGKRSNHNPVDLDKNPCWFCLSSPTVEKHLIVAIGNFCYLTLAKGGLTDEHLLLVPIEHIQSVNSQHNSSQLLAELEQFEKSLVQYFNRKSMGVVFFERNFHSAHWQIQVVPISLKLIEELPSKIKSISMKHYDKCNYIDIPKSCSIADVIPPGAPYMYWQLEPSGERFVTQIELKGSFFSVQLPRLVLADSQLMNCKDRVDWKKCTKSREEYIELTKQIKKNYAQFDFT